MLKCALCIVRRININALHLSRIIRQQRLQRLQIVALNQHVFRVRVAVGLDGFQQAVRRAAGGLQILFAGKPSQRGHGVKRSVLLGVVGWERLYANAHRLSKAQGARHAKSLASGRPACRRGRKNHPKIRTKLRANGQVRFPGQRLQTIGPPGMWRASFPFLWGSILSSPRGSGCHPRAKEHWQPPWQLATMPAPSREEAARTGVRTANQEGPPTVRCRTVPP